LDLPTLTVLENFLQQFQGSVIIVSHDRYFMDRIVGNILAFEGDGNIKNFTGNFSEYRLSKKEIPITTPSLPETKTTTETKNNPGKKKLSYKEQRELETIEKEMPMLEEKRNKILAQLNNENDYQIIANLSAELENLTEELESHELRWLELQEILG
jgi:ATP-binding cassette subfamily F protein uup